MLQAFLNIFRIPDLRNKVVFTMAMLAIYRIGFWIPLPGVNQEAVKSAASRASEDATGFGRLLDYASIFSGGSRRVFARSTIRPRTCAGAASCNRLPERPGYALRGSF